MTYNEIKGDLIEAAKNGKVNVVAHGCNCFNRQGRGIAPLMKEAFGTDKFPMEMQSMGSFYKLGNIDWKEVKISDNKVLTVINCYSQYHFTNPGFYGIPLDYDALRLCLRKINVVFPGMHIGLPKIGCGLAGGDWEYVRKMIQEELKSMDVTVYYL